MSTRWQGNHDEPTKPPPLDWGAVTIWLGTLTACMAFWAGIVLLVGHLLGWSW